MIIPALALLLVAGPTAAQPFPESTVRPELPLIQQPFVQAEPLDRDPDQPLARAPRVPRDPEEAGWSRPPRTGLGLAGWRSSWLDGVPVRLAEGGSLGHVEGFVHDAQGQVAAVVALDDGGTVFRAVPRDRLRIDGDGPDQVVTVAMPAEEAARLAPP